MAITPPPTLDPAPTKPQRNDRDNFSGAVDAFVTWLIALVAKANAIASNIYNNALEAFAYATAAGSSAAASAGSAQAADASARNAADSATAAGVISGATLWVSGQTVPQDAARICPVDRRTYRRKTASGSGTTPPSQDATNYVLLSADSSSYIKLAEATISSAVANIDFLNIFSDAYIKYVVEFLSYAADGTGFSLRMAVNGVVDAGSNYFLSGNTSNSAVPGTPNPGANFSIEFRGMRTSSAGKSISLISIFPGSSPGVSNYGWSNPAMASGFRLFFSNGGNFTAGTIRVYGVRA